MTSMVEPQSYPYFNRYWMLAGIILVVALVYSSSLGFGLVSDDWTVLGNKSLRWDYVGRYFSNHEWGVLDQAWGSAGWQYRPVFLIWALLNQTVFGSRAFGWHLSTLCLHLLVTACVYSIALRVIRDHRTSLIGAAIFGLHPVAIEVVAWISAASEALVTVLFALAFLSYLTARRDWVTPDRSISISRKNFWCWIALSVFQYSLATLAKETAIVFPGLIVIGEWVFFKEVNSSEPKLVSFLRRSTFVIMPYLLVTVLYFVLREYANSSGTGLISDLATTIGRGEFLTWPALIMFYLRRLFWPVGLRPHYGNASVTEPFVAMFWISTACLLVVASFTWWMVRRIKDPGNRRAVKVLLAWILLPLMPLLDLAYFSEENYNLAHDRYVYISTIGFAIIVALALRKVKMGRIARFRQPVAQIVLVSLLLICFAAGTATQVRPWANELSLHSNAVRLAPPDDTLALWFLGREQRAQGTYDQALATFLKIKSLRPNERRVEIELALTYFQMADYPNAEDYLERTVMIAPTTSIAYAYLILTKLRLNKTEEAGALAEIARSVRADVRARGPALQPLRWLLGGTSDRGRLQAEVDNLLAAATTESSAEVQRMVTQINDLVNE